MIFLIKVISRGFTFYFSSQCSSQNAKLLKKGQVASANSFTFWENHNPKFGKRLIYKTSEYFFMKKLKVKVVFYGQISFEFTPESIYLFKFSNRSTRKRYEICPKLTIKTLRSLVLFWCLYFFIVHCEHISSLFLVFLLLTSNR